MIKGFLSLSPEKLEKTFWHFAATEVLRLALA
jgi:hypothetical protein